MEDNDYISDGTVGTSPTFINLYKLPVHFTFLHVTIGLQNNVHVYQCTRVMLY